MCSNGSIITQRTSLIQLIMSNSKSEASDSNQLSIQILDLNRRSVKM